MRRLAFLLILLTSPFLPGCPSDAYLHQTDTLDIASGKVSRRDIYKVNIRDGLADAQRNNCFLRLGDGTVLYVGNSVKTPDPTVWGAFKELGLAITNVGGLVLKGVLGI